MWRFGGLHGWWFTQPFDLQSVLWSYFLSQKYGFCCFVKMKVESFIISDKMVAYNHFGDWKMAYKVKSLFKKIFHLIFQSLLWYFHEGSSIFYKNQVKY